MNFERDPAIDAFRDEVRGFLREHLSADLARRTLRGYHPLKSDMVAWTRILHARGWSAPHWPVEHGGPGWSPLQRHLFEEECALAGAPPTCTAAFSLVAPVIYSFGTEPQKRRHLPPILRGDTFWGQGFSEPNAGSDLASLRTRAERDGDHYIVNGQKTWTTEGHYADWLFVLVRTDVPEPPSRCAPAPEGLDRLGAAQRRPAKPQRGISFLLIDARTPGITIRPIISIDDAHSLNEVFFDDVRVPVENRIGDEGQGWSFGKLLLDNERAFSAEVPRNKRMLARLKAIAASQGLFDDPVFAQRVAEVEVELAALEWLTLRALGEHGSDAASAWPAGSVLHVLGSELQQKTGALLVEALGERGVVAYPPFDGAEAPAGYPPGPDHAPGVTADFLYRRAVTIYGGSNEIQRNLIARHLLGA
jgi:alkylation response protein AidB-like acyl-CoA dehydrogenase